MKNEWKGYIGVLIATIAMSNVYVFSKAALKELDLIQFGVYWFGFALLWNILYLGLTGKYKSLFKTKKKQVKILILLGLMEIIATTGFFAAIKLMHNPANVSFLANIGPVYVVLLGYWLLKEELTRYEIIGGILTLIGAFIISYKPNWEFDHNFLIGLSLIMIYTFVFALGKIISKKNIKDINPSVLTINRVIFLFVFSLTVFIFNGENLEISNTALINTILGSILGPLLAAGAGYYAIQFIPASKASLLGTFKGFLVLLTSYLYFDIFPLWYQVLGGSLTVLGVVTITLAKQIKNKKLKQQKANLSTI